MAKPDYTKTEIEEILTTILDEITPQLPITKRILNRSHILVTLSIPTPQQIINILIIHTKYPIIEIDDGAVTTIDLSNPNSIPQIIRAFQYTIEIYTRYKHIFAQH